MLVPPRKKMRSLLGYLLVLLWVFHFSFGNSFHYHPTYTHSHAGALEPHHHGGHFHSQEVETIADFLHQNNPLWPGETHHHSEPSPGTDRDSAQLDFNKSILLPDKSFVPVKVAWSQTQFFALSRSKQNFHFDVSQHFQILKFPSSISERSPPLHSI